MDLHKQLQRAAAKADRSQAVADRDREALQTLIVAAADSMTVRAIATDVRRSYARVGQIVTKSRVSV